MAEGVTSEYLLGLTAGKQDYPRVEVTTNPWPHNHLHFPSWQVGYRKGWVSCWREDEEGQADVNEPDWAWELV